MDLTRKEMQNDEDEFNQDTQEYDSELEDHNEQSFDEHENKVEENKSEVEKGQNEKVDQSEISDESEVDQSEINDESEVASDESEVDQSDISDESEEESNGDFKKESKDLYPNEKIGVVTKYINTRDVANKLNELKYDLKFLRQELLGHKTLSHECNNTNYCSHNSFEELYENIKSEIQNDNNRKKNSLKLNTIIFMAMIYSFTIILVCFTYSFMPTKN